MELIAHCIQSGRQAIVLIPEIALTYQTVMRFFARFGNRVSIINSRLSMMSVMTSLRELRMVILTS